MEDYNDDNENDPSEENIAYSSEIKNGGLKLKIKFKKNTTGSKKSRIEIQQNQQYLPDEVPNISGASELPFVPNEVPPSTSLHEVSATLLSEATAVPNETTFMEIFHAASTSTVNIDSRLSLPNDVMQNSSVLSYNSESDRNSSVEILNNRSLSPQPGPSGLQRSSNTAKSTLLQELSMQLAIHIFLELCINFKFLSTIAIY